jgi:hypothetical protein
METGKSERCRGRHGNLSLQTSVVGATTLVCYWIAVAAARNYTGVDTHLAYFL